MMYRDVKFQHTPGLMAVDRIGERVAAAARAPGTVIVDYRKAIPGRRVGPYAIFTVPP